MAPTAMVRNRVERFSLGGLFVGTEVQSWSESKTKFPRRLASYRPSLMAMVLMRRKLMEIIKTAKGETPKGRFKPLPVRQLDAPDEDEN